MIPGPSPPTEPRSVGRYFIHHEFAVGGMARVCLGKLRGEADFSRVIAIKQLFPQYARDPEFVRMFQDEARVAARVRHPNVVGTLDIVSDGGELFIVMEYIAGETLSRLLATARERFEPLEPAIACAVMRDLLEGLHAAHTATGPGGVPLNIVHRDVSPQNVLVGDDGVARVVDFGVAKAIGRMQTTDDGQVKGKIVYMPPEQMGGTVDLRADIWAAGAVLWEMLAGRRMFEDVGAALAWHSGNGEIEPPSSVGRRETPLDAVAMRALSRSPDDRFHSARDMIVALERAVPPAPARRVGLWVQRLAEATLAKRRALVADVEAFQPPAKGELGQSTLSAASVQAEPGRTEGRSGLRAVLPFVATVAATAAIAVAVVVGRSAEGRRSEAPKGAAPTSDTSAPVESAGTTTKTTPSSELPPPPPTALASASARQGTRPHAPTRAGAKVAVTSTPTTATTAASAPEVAPAHPEPPSTSTSTAPVDPRELNRRK